jgi:hypothetical protein
VAIVVAIVALPGGPRDHSRSKWGVSRESVENEHRVLWNLSLTQAGQSGGFGRGAGATAQPGAYTVTLEAAGKKLSKPLTLLEDVWMREDR